MLARAARVFIAACAAGTALAAEVPDDVSVSLGVSPDHKHIVAARINNQLLHGYSFVTLFATDANVLVLGDPANPSEAVHYESAFPKLWSFGFSTFDTKLKKPHLSVTGADPAGTYALAAATVHLGTHVGAYVEMVYDTGPPPYTKKNWKITFEDAVPNTKMFITGVASSGPGVVNPGQVWDTFDSLTGCPDVPDVGKFAFARHYQSQQRLVSRGGTKPRGVATWRTHARTRTLFFR